MYKIFKNMLENALIGMFEYENLPDGVTQQRIEKELLENGNIIFTNIVDEKFCVSKIYGNYKYNFYGDIVSAYAKSPYTKFNKKCNNGVNAIFIKNNINFCSDLPIINKFASHLARAYNLKDKNVLLSNFIGLIETKEPKQAKQLKEEINRIINGKSPFIVTPNKSLAEQLNAVSFGVSLNSTELWDNLNNILAMFFTYYGINNNAVDKKERLVVDEVNANNTLLSYVVADRYEQRKQAIKEINELYNLNITIRLRGADDDIKKRTENGNNTNDDDKNTQPLQ